MFSQEYVKWRWTEEEADEQVANPFAIAVFINITLPTLITAAAYMVILFVVSFSVTIILSDWKKNQDINHETVHFQEHYAK